MPDKNTLQKMRDDLTALHASNLPAEEKDQAARKLRRQIRKLAAQLGEPSSQPREKKAKRIKKGGNVIDLSYIKTLNQSGEEVTAGNGQKDLTKAEKRRARRERREKMAALGLTPEQWENREPSWKHRQEIARLLESDFGLKPMSLQSFVSDQQAGYGYLLPQWPAESDKTTMEAKRGILEMLTKKFSYRMGDLKPQWFSILRNGPGAIVTLGPIPEGYPRIGRSTTID